MRPTSEAPEDAESKTPSGRPSGPLTGDNYLLEGLLFCALCRHFRQPAPAVDGARFYSCAPGCAQADTEATSIEQQTLLKAMVRAHAVLNDGTPKPAIAFTEPSRLLADDPDQADDPARHSDEKTSWLQCDTTSHRAVLRTAYLRVDIDENGQVRPIWRHRAGTTAS